MVHKLKVSSPYLIMGFGKGGNIFTSTAQMDFANRGNIIEKIKRMRRDPMVTSVWVEKITPTTLFQHVSLVDNLRRERYMFKHDKPNKTEIYFLTGAKMFPEVMPHIARARR